MKVISYNIQGLKESTKAKALWSWILSADLDVCCIQEHKLHHLAGLTSFYKGYTMFYGGIAGSYSGTLTCVKSSLQPSRHFNHDSGRCLGINITLDLGTISVFNIYAFNEHRDRTCLWKDLALLSPTPGLFCGDFNMVLDTKDSTTGASSVTWSENQAWELVSQTHNLFDAWSMLHPASAFTYHSQAYSKAWARLDRVYLSGLQWCPPTISLQVERQWHLSDHFPLVLTLHTYYWHQQMKGNTLRRPLMVNNLHCGKTLFRAYVTQVCLVVSDMQGDATQKWISFVKHMQYVIKITGKWYAHKDRKVQYQHKSVLSTLRAKANTCPLSPSEEQTMANAIAILHKADVDASKKAQFLARCSAITDVDCISKGFFDKLRVNRNRTSLASLTMDDGTCIIAIEDIAHACTSYFGRILSTPPQPSTVKEVALRAILQYVDKVISPANADRMESLFTMEEITYALRQLQNDKTPGIDGLTKEFMLQFWDQLKGWVLDIVNQAWISQSLPHDISQGIIKLLPKQPFCTTLSHWRPITMMGILYKILAKAIAIRLNPLLRQAVHSSQSGFIGGRSIYDNILTVQLGIEYAQRTKQETVLMQLDFAKAFDSVSWGFISKTLHHMGFGSRISNAIHMLGGGATSVLSINGCITDPITIHRSVRQGCPLSPLLFAVATHPLFCMLEKVSNDGILHGLRLQNKNLSGLGFADDTLMMLRATNQNIETCLTLMNVFSDASDLQLNIEKSTLIDVSACNFDALIWPGKRVHRGTVFRYLGYPLGVDVTNKQLLDWVLDRIRTKILYWHSSEWPLHVRLRITQAILIPYVLYFLPLLDWKKSHIDKVNTLLIRFMWNAKPQKPVTPPIKWDLVSTPKNGGGLGILNLETHMHARRATFIHHMFDRRLQWTECLWGLISLGTVYFHGHWTLTDWDKLFSHAPLKVYAHHASTLIKSWKMSCARLIWKGRIRYTGNSLKAENVHWSFIFKHPPALTLGLHSRYLANKGIMHLSHVLDSEGTFLCFFMVRNKFKLGPQYRIPWHELCTFIHNLQVPTVLNETDRFRDWALPVGTPNWWQAATSHFYNLLTPSMQLSDRGVRMWHLTRSHAWWVQILANVWKMQINLQSKVFMWRLYAGGLLTAEKLLSRGFTDGKCPRCRKAKETLRHAFWFCPTVLEWWNQLKTIMQRTTGISLSRYHFTFALKLPPAPQHVWLINHVRYWLFNLTWLTRNEALFNGITLYSAGLPIHRLKTYLFEAFVVDAGIRGDGTLLRCIEQLGGS